MDETNYCKDTINTKAVKIAWRIILRPKVNDITPNRNK